MKWNKILMLIIAICIVQIASGQNKDKKSQKIISITGKVLNMDHEPVEGAVFYVDNIKTNIKSKSNGSYKIKVSPSARMLRVESSEYVICDTLINNQTTINFVLTSIMENQFSSSELKKNENEIQNISGIPVRKKAKKMNTYNDIYQMIRSEVSGVIVSGKSIQIQQGHSFFGSSEPLFLVNGVIVNSIDNINPLEVKSISVLKGSSAAIYGERGSNGVLSITLIDGSEKER